MIRLIRAYMAVLAAGLEKFAAELSEDAKTYPTRQFYRGYQQGLQDGLAEAEHAKRWLTTKEGTS